MVFEVRRVSEWVSQCVLICVWVCNPMDCSLPGTSVHGILQARLLEGVAIFYFRGSSQPRDWTHVLSPALANGFSTTALPGKPWGQKEAGLMRKTLETVRVLEQEPRGAWTGLWPLFLKCPGAQGPVSVAPLLEPLTVSWEWIQLWPWPPDRGCLLHSGFHHCACHFHIGLTSVICKTS